MDVHTQHTHTCSPNLYPQQSESLQEGGKTKVGGKKQETRAEGWGPTPVREPESNCFLEPTPTAPLHLLSHPPRPPQFPRWPLHLPPFNAASGLERCCSPSRRAAGSLRGSHSSLQGWGLGNEEGLQSQGGDGVPGVPLSVRQFWVSQRVPRGSGGRAWLSHLVNAETGEGEGGFKTAPHQKRGLQPRQVF